MVKSILLAKDIGRFTKDISDRDKEAKKASVILKVVLDAQSPRISDISQAMLGNLMLIAKPSRDLSQTTISNIT